MSRLQQGVSDLNRRLQNDTGSWCLDLGSSTTRMATAQRLRYQRPSVMTYEPETQTVVSLGQQRLTAAPNPSRVNRQALETIEPIATGRFTDAVTARIYLEALLQQRSSSLTGWRRWLPWQGKTVVAVPSGSFPSDQLVLRDLLTAAGWTSVALIPKAHVHWHHFRSMLTGQNVAAVVDIGGQTTDLTICTTEQVLYSRTLESGGDRLTKIIQRLLHDDFQLQVSWSTAEKAKTQLAGFWPASQTTRFVGRQLSFRGQDSLTQAPRTVVVQAGELARVYQPWLHELLEFVQSSFTVPVVRVVAKHAQPTLILTGGGSQTPGLFPTLEEDLGWPTVLSSSPATDVITGLQGLI